MKTFRFTNIGITLIFFAALIGELYRFKGMLLVDIAVPTFTTISLAVLILQKKLKTDKTFIPAVLFFLIGFASLLFNSGGMGTRTFLESSFYGFRWIFMYLLYLVIISNSQKNNYIYWSVFIFGALLSIAGFVQLKFYPDFMEFTQYGWDPHRNRLLSTWFDPNFTGEMLAFILTILLGFIFKEKRYHSLLMLMGAIMLSALFLTYSRSAYLSLILAFTIFGLLRSIKIVIAGLGIFIILLTFSDRAQERFYDLGVSIGSVFGENYQLPDPSGRIRFLSWQEGYNLFIDSPIIGQGYNAFAHASSEIGKLKDPKVHAASGSDSSLLTILATTGIVGFIPFVSIYIFLAIHAWKNRQNSIQLAYFCAICGLFLHSVFVNSLLFPLIMAQFWIVSGRILKENIS